jgi:hypothetical protein
MKNYKNAIQNCGANKDGIRKRWNGGVRTHSKENGKSRQ